MAEMNHKAKMWQIDSCGDCPVMETRTRNHGHHRVYFCMFMEDKPMMLGSIKFSSFPDDCPLSDLPDKFKPLSQ